MIHPVKCLHVTQHGIATLQKRILPLRAKLKRLESAQTKLSNMRYNADLELAHVTKIPTNMTKKKLEEDRHKLLKSIGEMSDEMREELFDELEKKLERR